MVTNIFDYFEEIPVNDEGASCWAARAPRRPQPHYDLKLTPRVVGWEDDRDSLQALKQIEAEPWVDEVIRHNGELRVRVTDAWIENTGAVLEAGGSAEASLDDLARERRYALQFWDPNATKALHVGHLRNLSIGNALAAALTQAGARVERRSLISDAGRTMGEAMAGVMESGRHGDEWPDGDVKSDHFVGLCYAEYVSGANGNGNALAGPEVEEAEDSQTRELMPRNDTADELVKRVLRGDSEALELWYKTRAWAISGQRKTLARLGIAFDRVFFESDFLADAADVIEQGLRDGILERRGDGVIVYPTGREDFEEMPLVRADGLSTQHLRAVSYWWGMGDTLEEITTVQVCGTEWFAHEAAIKQLMGELKANGNGSSAAGNGHAAHPGEVHPSKNIFHGMVARQKRARMASSEGALLIDELADWVDQQIDADPQRCEVRAAHPFPERIAAQVALGYFLPQPATPRVEFDPARLLREGESLGWDLVRARARCGQAAGSNGGRPVTDPDYRFATVQSELYRRYLRLASERFDVRPLAHYLKHLSIWYLEYERAEHTERVVHTLLERSTRGLGLEAAI